MDLFSFAEETRKQFELGLVSKELLKFLYINYNNKVNIDEFIPRALELFPKLNCGLCSVYLQHLLQKGILINGSFGHFSHSFLLVDDKVIDITADQYGGPRIYVGPLKHPWSTRPAKVKIIK